MFDLLKTHIKALAFNAKDIRQKERHYITNSRNLRGNFPKKHGIEQEPPRPTEKQLKASTLENAKELAERDDYTFFNLHRFRVHTLRKEARDMHLAYGFLKGNAFFSMEGSRYSDPDFKNIERIVTNNIPQGEDMREVIQRFEEWVQRAKEFIPLGHRVQ
ncbi:MAG TPA: hypothetical protein PLS50_00315 [Candidatus Dojkabacteria bacterium]|nr:hypothetical protein [Candidatus Dojkabacteria bacterium]